MIASIGIKFPVVFFKGIETRPFFYPLSEMPPYEKFSREDFPIVENISKNGLSLPTSANLRQNELDSIIEALIKTLKYEYRKTTF